MTRRVRSWADLILIMHLTAVGIAIMKLVPDTGLVWLVLLSVNSFFVGFLVRGDSRA